MASTSFVDFVELALYAAAPSAYLPGSKGKLTLMRLRADLGLPVQVLGDQPRHVHLADLPAFQLDDSGARECVQEGFDGWLRADVDGRVVGRRPQQPVRLHEHEEPACRGRYIRQ
jgi:hypothetical protein